MKLIQNKFKVKNFRDILPNGNTIDVGQRYCFAGAVCRVCDRTVSRIRSFRIAKVVVEQNGRQ